MQKTSKIQRAFRLLDRDTLDGMDINPNYALQTPNNKEQMEKSVSYGVLSSLECSPKRCIPLELKIVRYLKPQGAANFTKSALLSGT